jgi:hypothetical protein
MGLAGAGVLVAAALPAAGQGEAAFPDGDWQGVMVYSATLAIDTASVAGTGDGSFSLTAAGGDITAGTFGFTATSEVAFEGGSGTATVSADRGTIAGPAGAPLLSPGALRITGTVSVQGITVPIDTVVPEADTSSLVLSIDAVGCDRVSGDMSQEITEQFEGLGVGVPQLLFRWSAIRAGADGAVTDALSGIVDAGDKLVVAALRGDLDPAALSDLLGEAEELAADLPSSGSCSAEVFSTPASGAVADLLAALVAEPGRASAGQLWGAINAGVRAGVLHEGSPLALQVAEALAARLEAATGAGEAYLVHLSARLLGADALAAEALDVAEAS